MGGIILAPTSMYPLWGFCDLATLFPYITRGRPITVTKGAIDQANFDGYPGVRIDEAPYQTNVYAIESSNCPAGMGEAGVSAIPRALCNGVFAATGKRIGEPPLLKALTG